MQRTRLYVAAAVLCGAALLAACGGGGGNPTPPTPGGTTAPTASPTTTPTSLPSPASQSNSATVTPSNSAATTAALPQTGGITATVTVPQRTSGSGTIAVTVASGGDATMARRALATTTMPGGPYLLQLDFVPSSTMTLAAVPSFSLDVTQYVTSAGLTISQAAAYLQGMNVYAGIESGGSFNAVGPLTVNATSSSLTVTYNGPAMALTLQANQHYTIGIHLGPITAPTSTPTTAPTSTPTTSPTSTPTTSPTSTPTTSPTSTPTPTPGPALAASPASVNVMGTGSTNMQLFVVSGGTGSYTASGYDTSVVTVTQDTVDPSQFDVTGVAAGSTTITITDSAGSTLSVPVTVTTASGTVN